MAIFEFTATFNMYGQCVNARGNGRTYPDHTGVSARPGTSRLVVFQIYCERPGNGRCWILTGPAAGEKKWCGIPWDNASLSTPPPFRDNYFRVLFLLNTTAAEYSVLQVTDGEGTIYPTSYCRPLDDPPADIGDPVEWEIFRSDGGDPGCCYMYVQGSWYCMPH